MDAACGLGSGDLRRGASTTREARSLSPAHDRSDSVSSSARDSRGTVRRLAGVRRAALPSLSLFLELCARRERGVCFSD